MHPRHWAEVSPEKPAIIYARTGEVITYRDLNERSIRCANLLRRAGLKPGDHMAVIMENHVRFLEIAWAAQRCGLYFTAISWRFQPSEVAYILEHSGARALIVSAQQKVLCEALPTDVTAMPRFVVGGELSGYDSYEQALANEPATPTGEETRGTDMLYSSGSTGKPKAVKLPIENPSIDGATALYAFFGQRYAWNEDTRYLLPAPLYHSGPLRFAMAQGYFGGTVILMDRFDAEESLKLCQQYRITHAHWVPTMMVRLLKLPEAVRKSYDMSTVRYVMSGAGPISIDTKKAMIQWLGPILEEAYGGTEGNGATFITSEEWLEHPGSVGKAAIGSIHVLDDDGNELPTGEIGTVYFEGAHFEYYKDPEKTRDAYNEKGWSTLGDMGYLDEEGYLYLCDRKNDMIIVNGVNVYPVEAEHTLVTHPKVADAAVFGLPDDESGERVHAVVQLAGGAAGDDALARQLIDYCRERIAHIKCPKTLDFRSQLPRHETGKLYKRLLKAEYLG